MPSAIKENLSLEALKPKLMLHVMVTIPKELSFSKGSRLYSPKIYQFITLIFNPVTFSPKKSFTSSLGTNNVPIWLRFYSSLQRKTKDYKGNEEHQGNTILWTLIITVIDKYDREEIYNT